jgi:DNA polymerase-3 subunit delta
VGEQPDFAQPAKNHNMVYLIFGENNFLAKRELSALVCKLQTKNLSLEILDFSRKADFKSFKEVLRSDSLFSSKKICVAYDLIANVDAEFKERFQKERKDILENTDNIVIFFESQMPRKNDAILTYLQKIGEVKECKQLTGLPLEKWISAELKEIGATAEPMAIKFLATNCGHDSWLLYNELQKLAAYKNGKPISLEDCQKMVKTNVQLNIFQTMDALLGGDKAQAISLLRRHLKNGESPQAMLGMIASQIRNVLVIKDLQERGLSSREAVAELKMHPFVVQKASQKAHEYSLVQLRDIYRKLLDLDIQSKTGQMDPELVLELVVNMV